MKMTKQNMETIHVDSRMQTQSIDKIHRELLEVLDHFYYTAARVDLQTDTVCILQSAGHPEAVLQELNWTEFLEVSTGLYVNEDRIAVLEGFSCDHLLELYRMGKTIFSMDALYTKNGVLNGMKLQALLQEGETGPLAYVMVRNASDDCLRKDIVNQYVYRSCDYFIYLDAKHDRYSIFSSIGLTPPLPPNQYDNYEAATAAYVDEFVVPEDQTRILREGRLKNVLSHLEHQEVYTLNYGVMDPRRGYTRKQLEYRYYERSSQTLLVSRTDVTETYLDALAQREALTEALALAHTDTLTSLLNYQGIVEAASKALERGVGHGALLFIDLDYFKSVNDTLGHLVGDQVLRRVAEILRREASGAPLIGRFGGDEFVVFYPDILSMEQVTSYAQRVCRAVSGLEYGQKAGDPHISCSIGIVEVPKDGRDYKDLAKKADDMAYQAKAMGKDRYVVYGAEAPQP